MDSDTASSSENGFVDPAAQHGAAVYARAFLGAAAKAGSEEESLQELESLVRDVLMKFPALEKVLVSGAVPDEDRSALLDRVFGGRATPLLLNFLKILSRRDRLSLLRGIAIAAREAFDESRGFVRVELSTAEPLAEGSSEVVTSALRNMLQREPRIETTVNPDLIGGVVVKVGDTIYDASVAAQLRKAHGQLIERSIHEIQFRRDRFCHSAGD